MVHRGMAEIADKVIFYEETLSQRWWSRLVAWGRNSDDKNAVEKPPHKSRCGSVHRHQIKLLNDGCWQSLVSDMDFTPSNISVDYPY